MSPDTAPEHRIERDALGEVRVPSDALWAAQTQRAIENFPVSGRPMPPAVVAAVLHLKAGAAVANSELGVVPREVADALVDAVDEALREHLDRQFPVDVFQTGSGTSTNMNVNEVVAELAGRRLGRRVHPNDEVNASQSSNDVIPTAIRAAALREVRHELLPALEVLSRSLRAAQTRFAEVVKAGRTHLMDAVPVTLGQEFGGYATAVELGVQRVEATLGRLAAMPLGGTATGTGLNAPAGFAPRALQVASERLDVVLHEAPDHFEAQGAQDVLVELSGALRTVAVSLNKVATDLRWMGSGPTTGLGELRLPSLQPGSSIMPGKVNPVIPEAVHQVVAQVVGNDAAVAFSGASGAFELNVMLPVMGRNVVESVQLLANASRLLAERCVDGLEADEATCRQHAESSPAIVTALAPVVGYDAAASVAKRAVAEGRTIIDVVLEEGLTDEATARRALDVLAMTRGGLLGS